MQVNLDKVPSNLDDAINMIVSSLDDDDKAYIKGHDDVDCHFTVGMSVRNGWSLWDAETVLVQWFKKTYRIIHADDISGMILSGVWATVRGEKFDPNKEVKRYHDHWLKSGINPQTMERI
jgi:hypothetical protein